MKKSKVVLAIDVGEVSMACCIMERSSTTTAKCNVLAWDVFSTKETPKEEFCNGKMANGSDCKFKPAYTTSTAGLFSCKRHSTTKELRKVPKFKKTPPNVLAINVNNAMNKFTEKNKNLLNRVTHVGIEKQVSANPTMQLISHYVLFYFTTFYANTTNTTNGTNENDDKKSVNVALISAKKKFAVYDGATIAVKYKDKKAQRKWYSIQVGEYLINNPDKSRIIFTEEQKKWYKSLRKKDDAAECQTLAYTMIMNKGENINF